MSYEVFKTKINALIHRSKSNLRVSFSTDEEKGKHYASFSDGTLIIGNLCSLKITVKWGGKSNNHVAVAAI